MYAILWSAAVAVFNWLLRAVVIKFVVFSAIAYLLSYIVSYMLSKVTIGDQFSTLGSLFSALPAGLLYYIGVFRLDLGIPLMIAAYFIRFGIRRLPIIG